MPSQNNYKLKRVYGRGVVDLEGKMPENMDEKKKKKPSVRDLARYNAYVKKETLAGRTPAPRDKWMAIHGGGK